MNYSDQEYLKFLHPVGMSTFKYGVTIPLEAQTQSMRAINKGEKVPVTILLGTEEPFIAEIRRLNNKLGHLQFRYENKAQEHLRQNLIQIFGYAKEGCLLEVKEVAPFVFLFNPILLGSAPSLQINDMLLHRLVQKDMDRIDEISQIKESLAAVEYDPGFSQSEYNKRINAVLTGAGWNREQRIVAELGLKCDFEKNGIWVEVEFGNARSYYQDYVKFMLAKKYRNSRLGVLICPTLSFASLLCELGRQRAQQNAVRERPPVYSGMMNYEKAARELPFLGFMFEMPVVVAGVGVSGK
ncbi:MAG: BglII/BstYI family type II restriction endonuclease [Geobacteraceae bacterium]|nr:BglII/BstYI family type II restriction endonuclease [Geobacteraceae bacterium]